MKAAISNPKREYVTEGTHFSGDNSKRNRQLGDFNARIENVQKQMAAVSQRVDSASMRYADGTRCCRWHGVVA
jgi:hypothetical protein